MEANIRLAETRQSKTIFPGTQNANHTLFGGEALKWMDEVASITATRYSRKKMFTVAIDNIKFWRPADKVCFVEVVGKVQSVGAVKLSVKVEMYVEQMYDDKKAQIAVEGLFVFVALDENHKPQRL